MLTIFKKSLYFISNVYKYCSTEQKVVFEKALCWKYSEIEFPEVSKNENVII